MSDKKFTDEEIIETLEDYIKENEFEYFHSNMVGEYPLIRKSLDLINRQKSEIERLQKEVNLVSILFQDEQERAEEYRLKIENLQNVISNQQIEISAKIENKIKAEAYKEFAEKLKVAAISCSIGGRYYKIFTKRDIDNFLKEMVGEEE